MLARLDRWADALPCTDTIPITEQEKYEIATLFHLPPSFPIETVLTQISAGTFRYKGHRLIVVAA